MHEHELRCTHTIQVEKHSLQVHQRSRLSKNCPQIEYPIPSWLQKVGKIYKLHVAEFEMMTEQESMWNGRSFVNVTLGCTTYVLQPSCRKTTHTTTSVKHGSPSSLNTQ